MKTVFFKAVNENKEVGNIPTSFYWEIRQSIGACPLFSKNAFTRENGREPKKPAYAESGLGCADSKIPCIGFVISAFLDLALLPHKIKAIGRSDAFR